MATTARPGLMTMLYLLPHASSPSHHRNKDCREMLLRLIVRPNFLLLLLLFVTSRVESSFVVAPVTFSHHAVQVNQRRLVTNCSRLRKSLHTSRGETDIDEELLSSSALLSPQSNVEESVESFFAFDQDVFACSALVAGTTVGAGIIALPAKTIAAGFVPSALVLVLGWIYMSATGLLIAEINVNTLCSLEEDTSGVSINTMAEETLGRTGATASSTTFLFLHYALLTAYVIQGSTLLTEISTKLAKGYLPEWFSGAAPTMFGFVLGGALFLLPTPQLEFINNAMVAGVIASFLALLAFGLLDIQVDLLTRADFGAAVESLPLIPVVYVFQTVVPTICSLLQCDERRIRTAILAGTAVPLLMFLSWSLVILGTVAYEETSSQAMVDPLETLRASGNVFGTTVQAFSILAVATSWLGFAYGLADFFADVFRWDSPLTSNAEHSPKENNSRKLVLATLTVLPPVAVATLDPSLFFSALDNAGTYGILVLFGILPAAMTWAQRYTQEENYIETSRDIQAISPDALVPGGRFSLAIIVGIALVIIGLETYEKFAYAFA